MDGPGDILIGLRIEADKISRVFRPGEEKILSQELSRDGEDALDCGGAHIVPGFADTHTHSFEGGFYHNCVSLKSSRDIEEVLQRLRSGRLIDGKMFAWEFDEHTVAENRWPSLEELDSVFPDIPVFIRRVDGHSSEVNTRAASLISWPGRVPDISAPLRGPDNHIASGWFHSGISDREILKAYQTAAEIALDGGIVRVHTMIGDGKSDMRHYRLIQDHIGDFPVEFVLYPQITDTRLAADLGSSRIGGCLLADGSIGSKTAALFEEYADSPGSTGILYKSDEQWTDIMKPAFEAGLDFCVHAIGDRAVNQIAGLYRDLSRRNPGVELRNQVIHCEMTPDSVVEKLVQANACCVMQPLFEAEWGGRTGLYARRLGEERAALCDRFRTLTDAGLLLTGGSDWYITEMDSIAGISAAVNHHFSGESLSPYEAVAMYTANAAILIGRGGFQGKILPGYDAELTFLENDPMDFRNSPSNRVTATLIRDRYVKNG